MKLIFYAILTWSVVSVATDAIQLKELPPELQENVDFFSKLDMVENLGTVEEISDADLKLAASTDALPVDSIPGDE